jgi:hypothetical protein
MKIRKQNAAIILLCAIAACQCLLSQNQAGEGEQSFSSRITALKSSLAANQEKLRNYQWTQSTQVSIKGEVRKEQEAQCRYGPDGKVQKTPIGLPPAPQTPPGGLKGRIIQKKVAEMKDYTERLKSLLGHYAPPDPQLIQAAKQAGNSNLNVSAGQATLTVRDYYKTGDSVSFVFDTVARQLRGYNVQTYLDDPKKDIVTLSNQFARLPDGTNYLAHTAMKAEEKQILITVTNSGYAPVNP